MLMSATKQKNGRWQSLFWSQDQDIFKINKHVTSKGTKHATNFSLKLTDFLDVRRLSPDTLTLVKKEVIGNTRLLLLYYQ